MGIRDGEIQARQQFLRQSSQAGSANCECSMKVFNNFVENHVEKTVTQIKKPHED